MADKVAKGTGGGTCPPADLWQSYWDEELLPLAAEAAERHLAGCAACRGELAALAERLAAVDPTGPSAPARGRRLAGRPAARMAVGVAAAAVLLAATAASPFGRAAAASVASTYTVSHLQTVSVTRSELQTMFAQLTANGHASLARYGSATASGLRQKPAAVPASQMAGATGLPDLWPTGLTGPATALVATGGSVTVQLHVRAVNALILDEGGTHLLPAALSGVPFTVQVPPRALWTGAAGTNAAGVTVAETRVPTLALPPGVNAREVWAAVQHLPFLPASVAQALQAMPAPGSTAIVPVGPSGRTVQFQGHRAVLAKTRAGWVLVYLKGTTLVVLNRAGSGSMTASAFVRWAAGAYQ